jgi:hypothetical protein
MATTQSSTIALACPLTGQLLRPLGAEQLTQLQQLAAKRALRNENAGLAPIGFEAGLQTADGARAYLVYDGVADLRPGAGVLL